MRGNVLQLQWIVTLSNVNVPEESKNLRVKSVLRPLISEPEEASRIRGSLIGQHALLPCLQIHAIPLLLSGRRRVERLRGVGKGKGKVNAAVVKFLVPSSRNVGEM